MFERGCVLPCISLCAQSEAVLTGHRHLKIHGANCERDISADTLFYLSHSSQGDGVGIKLNDVMIFDVSGDGETFPGSPDRDTWLLEPRAASRN